MAEILHQLRLIVYPIIYRVYIPGGCLGFQPSTVSHILFSFRSQFFQLKNTGWSSQAKKVDDEELGFVGEVTGVTSLVAKMKVAFLVTQQNAPAQHMGFSGEKTCDFFLPNMMIHIFILVKFDSIHR